MNLRLIIPPAELAVSLNDARVCARLDGTDLDAELERVVRMYTKEAEHLTGRVFINQTWALTLDRFPVEIALPKPPLVSVVHVKYYDRDGVLQTLPPDDYRVDSASEPAKIKPAMRKYWPATAAYSDAVEVQFTCGYGPDESKVPDEAKGYILAKAQEHFAPPGTPKNEHLCRLLDSVKVY